MQPPVVRTGLEWLSARWLNRFMAYLRTCVIEGDGETILVDPKPCGQEIRALLPRGTNARITGGSSPYDAVEVFAVPGGGWSPRPQSRTFAVGAAPLYEKNGSASVAVNAIVWAERDGRSGAWVFEGSCS